MFDSGARVASASEGIVSKRLDRTYGADRCKYWIKIKNRAYPVYDRVKRAVSPPHRPHAALMVAQVPDAYNSTKILSNYPRTF